MNQHSTPGRTRGYVPGERTAVPGAPAHGQEAPSGSGRGALQFRAGFVLERHSGEHHGPGSPPAARRRRVMPSPAWAPLGAPARHLGARGCPCSPHAGRILRAGAGEARGAPGAQRLLGAAGGWPQAPGLQLPLPYKAGAGRAGGRAGEGLRRAGPSEATLAARGPRSAEAAGAQECARPAMGKSGEAAGRGAGCGRRALWDARSHLPGLGGRRGAGMPLGPAARRGPRRGWSGAGGRAPGGAPRAVSGAARKPGWPRGRPPGREGGKARQGGGTPRRGARDCAREGFQARRVRPRRGCGFVSGGQSYSWKKPKL